MTLADPGLLAALARLAQPILNFTPIRRTRRNHGLEHATITLLARRVRGLQMAGRSDASGFYLIGDVPTPQIESAVHEALRRLRSGERGLAVHPNCGTNLVTTGLIVALVALVSTAGTARKTIWDRLPLVMLGVMGALLYAPALGFGLQRHFTTDGDPGDLTIHSVQRRTIPLPAGGTLVVHRVRTLGG
jgi:hypothetical protein